MERSARAAMIGSGFFLAVVPFPDVVWRTIMVQRTTHTYFTGVAMLVCISSLQNLAIAGNSEPSEKETREFHQELARIGAMDRAFTPGPTNDLGQYEQYADTIQRTWSQRNKVYYARLMSAVCGPLSSGRFNSDRQHELARKYAIAALANRDAFPLAIELELTGHVMTPTIGPRASTLKEEDFAQRRLKDVELRLHAWKRLMDAVDPNWDPDKVPQSPNGVGADLGIPAGGIAPEDIRDAALRDKYKAAIDENRRQIDRYTQQSRLRDWLKTFPQSAEHYIIQAYSHPPYNTEELRKELAQHKIDESARARMLAAVKKNCENEKNDGPLLPDGINQILGRLHPHISEAQVEKVVKTYYPTTKATLGPWSGQTGYVEFKLTPRHSISVAEYNAPGDLNARFVHADMILYVYDCKLRQRIKIDLSTIGMVQRSN